jgi:hypothetical protein
MVLLPCGKCCCATIPTGVLSVEVELSVTGGQDAFGKYRTSECPRFEPALGEWVDNKDAIYSYSAAAFAVKSGTYSLSLASSDSDNSLYLYKADFGFIRLTLYKNIYTSVLTSSIFRLEIGAGQHANDADSCRYTASGFNDCRYRSNVGAAGGCTEQADSMTLGELSDKAESFDQQAAGVIQSVAVEKYCNRSDPSTSNRSLSFFRTYLGYEPLLIHDGVEVSLPATRLDMTFPIRFKLLAPGVYGGPNTIPTESSFDNSCACAVYLGNAPPRLKNLKDYTKSGPESQYQYEMQIDSVSLIYADRTVGLLDS